MNTFFDIFCKIKNIEALLGEKAYLCMCKKDIDLIKTKRLQELQNALLLLKI